jgi:serine/threonine protein kinase
MIVGQGAFGIVYKARCLDTEEIFAVKKVLQDKTFKSRELELL